MTPLQAEHGGPDSGPPAAFDFSTNASPLGPPPALLAAVQAADRRNYPDPATAHCAGGGATTTWCCPRPAAPRAYAG